MNSATQPPKLLDQGRYRLRRLGLALRTEDVILDWINRFLWIWQHIF